MARKSTPKSASASDKNPRTKQLDRDKISPLFNIGVDEAEALSFDDHVEAAAAGISELLDGMKEGGVAPKNFGITNTLHGLWVKDGTANHFDTNIQDVSRLHMEMSQHHAGGLRPTDMLGSTQFFEPWTVVYGPRGDLGYYWWPDMSPSQFAGKHDELVAAGFRLSSWNIRHGRFNATWGPRGGNKWQPLYWNMSWFELLSIARAFHDRGLRIETIDRYGDGGNLYAASWYPGDGEQIIEAPGGLNVYFGQPSKFLVYKYAPRLHVHAMGHNGFPVAVYRPKPYAAKQEWIYLPRREFMAYDASCRADGYRLSFLSHASWQFG